MTIETTPYDTSEYLDTPDMIAAYLEAVFEDGDPALIGAALGDVARAKGMTAIARETGLSRESLYRALSSEGRPEFATILKVLRALDLRLTTAPILTEPPSGDQPKKAKRKKAKGLAAAA